MISPNRKWEVMAEEDDGNKLEQWKMDLHTVSNFKFYFIIRPILLKTLKNPDWGAFLLWPVAPMEALLNNKMLCSINPDPVLCDEVQAPRPPRRGLLSASVIFYCARSLYRLYSCQHIPHTTESHQDSCSLLSSVLWSMFTLMCTSHILCASWNKGGLSHHLYVV